MQSACRLAVVGATGEVGRAVLSLLEDEELPLAEVHALASAASEDESLMFKGRPLLVEDLAAFDFSRADIAVFAVPADVSEAFVPRARAAGCRVIDHSAAYRLDPAVPLLLSGMPVPPADLVACPGAVAALLAPVLRQLPDIRSAQITVLNPVSAAGRAGVRELAGQTGELLNGRGIEPAVFPVQIAFNAIPQATEESAAGLMDELERLLPASFPVVVAEVAVPVFYGLTVAVVVELASMPDLAGFQHGLEKDGVVLAGGQPDQEVATAVTEASGQGGVYVDRLQALPAPLQGLQFWLVADNVRQGAAKNSVHLLKNWIKDFKY